MARITVQLTPRAARSELVAVEVAERGAVVVRARVAAPPVDGKANAALELLLAHALDIPPSRVEVVGGATARRKLVEVDGLTLEEVGARLRAPRR